MFWKASFFGKAIMKVVANASRMEMYAPMKLIMLIVTVLKGRNLSIFLDLTKSNVIDRTLRIK